MKINELEKQKQDLEVEIKLAKEKKHGMCPACSVVFYNNFYADHRYNWECPKCGWDKEEALKGIRWCHGCSKKFPIETMVELYTKNYTRHNNKTFYCPTCATIPKERVDIDELNDAKNMILTIETELKNLRSFLDTLTGNKVS